MKFPEWPTLTDESPQATQHRGLIVDQQQAQGSANWLRSGRGGILHDARSSAKSGPLPLRKIRRLLERGGGLSSRAKILSKIGTIATERRRPRRVGCPGDGSYVCSGPACTSTD